MLDGEGMIWAWPFEQLLEVVRGTLGGLSPPLRSAVATSEPSRRCLFFFLLGTSLLVLGLQLLYPQARWGPCIPLDLIVEVVRRGSLSLVDAFDVSLGGTCHETFMRGVMAPPARVRVEGQLQFSYEEVVERFHDIFDHPHELIVRWGWRRALRHKVANGLYSVAETRWERCWGALDKVF